LASFEEPVKDRTAGAKEASTFQPPGSRDAGGWARLEIEWRRETTGEGEMGGPAAQGRYRGGRCPRAVVARKVPGRAPRYPRGGPEGTFQRRWSAAGRCGRAAGPPRPGGRSSVPEPIEQFHRLQFDDSITAAQWADRLAVAVTAPANFRYLGVELRPVVWRTLPHGAPERPGYVFLSEGAIRIARELNMTMGATTAVTLADMPSGLSLLIGDREDIEAYGRTRRGRGRA
jgi:hypothetical protein